MTRRLGLALLACLVLAPAAGAAPERVLTPAKGQRVAAIAVDTGRVLLAENPTGEGCAQLRLIALRGATTTITRTCASGGRFDEGLAADRGLGLALDRAMWRLRLPDGGAQIAIGGGGEAEQVMASVPAGSPTSLGPIVGQFWLRLYGSVRDGRGWITSGNAKVKWRSDVAYAPVALDDEEHVVAVGPTGAIAMFHPHGTVYARAVAADARTAAVDGARVLVLRRDLRTIDVRRLDGTRTATHRLTGTAAPILDACDGAAVAIVDGAVRRIDLATWRDRVVHRPARGTEVLDAQIAPGFIAVLERGPAAPAGRVLIYPRA